MHPVVEKHIFQTSICLGKEILQMQNMTKFGLYQSLRTEGKRLYSTKTWMNASALMSPIKQSTLHMHGQKRLLRSVSVVDNNTTFMERMKEKIGFQGGLKYPQKVLAASGFRLYLSAAEAVIYNHLYQNLTIPNTLQSWHRLTTLHLWLVMTRLRDFGRDGKLVRNQLIKGLQTDLAGKTKQIGAALEIRVKKEEHEVLHEQFIAALFNYDEGLLGSDRHLAGAVWRSVFSQAEDVNPMELELLVQYIRKQVAHLETIQTEEILGDGFIPFAPLLGNKIDPSVYERLDALRKANVQTG